MPNLTKLILASLGTLLVTLPTLTVPTGPANAHHSFAHFDQKVCKVITGAVRKWEFTYPHTWLWVTAKGPDDSEVLWGFEGSDPAFLSIYGWTAELLFKGDEVTVSYNPLRDGRNGGSIRSVVLPNGERIQGQGTNNDVYFSKCEEVDEGYVSDQTEGSQTESTQTESTQAVGDQDAGADSVEVE